MTTTDPVLTCTNSLITCINAINIKVNWKIERAVATYEQKYRGRELPGFINYKTFEAMMKEQIKQLEEPAVTKLKDVAGRPMSAKNDSRPFSVLTMHFSLFCVCFLDLVKNGFIQLAQCSFVGFPNLFKAAKVAFSWSVATINVQFHFKHKLIQFNG